MFYKEIMRALGSAEALIELMRDRLNSDESARAQRLVDGANEWLENIDDIVEMVKGKE